MDIAQLAQQATASTISTAKINWMLYMGAVTGAALTALGAVWYLYTNARASEPEKY
jgi:hypothetical protein